MNSSAILVLAQQNPGQMTGQMPKEARAWTLMGVFGVALGGLILLILVTVAVMIVRRRRRLDSLKAETQRRRAMDPWSEAGRRAETPSAEDLEES